jgi:hypothetical protein
MNVKKGEDYLLLIYVCIRIILLSNIRNGKHGRLRHVFYFYLIAEIAEIA